MDKHKLYHCRASLGPLWPEFPRFKVRKLLKLDYGLHTIPVAQMLCTGMFSCPLFRKENNQLILICSSFENCRIAYSKKTQFNKNWLFSSIVPTWNINKHFLITNAFYINFFLSEKTHRATTWTRLMNLRKVFLVYHSVDFIWLLKMHFLKFSGFSSFPPLTWLYYIFLKKINLLDVTSLTLITCIITSNLFCPKPKVFF